MRNMAPLGRTSSMQEHEEKEEENKKKRPSSMMVLLFQSEERQLMDFCGGRKNCVISSFICKIEACSVFQATKTTDNEWSLDPDQMVRGASLSIFRILQA